MIPASSTPETSILARTLSFWRQVLGRTTESLAADQPTQAGEERRVWVRYPASAETVCEPVAAGDRKGLLARVQNISRGGINLLLDRGLQTGSLLCVELPGPSAHASYTVLAYVIHARSRPGGQWALGCAFARELSDLDLEAFGAQRVRSNVPDQRHWVRFPCSLKALYHPVTTGQVKKWPAKVVDISANGIGLMVAQPVDAGALLSVELEGATPQAARVMLACVARVNRESGEERLLGCNFIRELTESELQAFL